MQLILRPTRTKNQLYNYTSQKYQKLRILPGLAPELLSQGSPKTRAFTEEGKEGEKTGREGERHPDGIHQTGFLGVPTLSGLCKGSACTCTHRAPRVPRPGLNFSYSKYAHHIFHSNNNNSSHGGGRGRGPVVYVQRWTKRWTCFAKQQPGRTRQKFLAT